ncbi:MAG: GDP-mannose 4,6-dehydratase [Chitinophagaceae bacterium]|nr:GDP-mannose 4,6-dehydratase [Chitinophagaceae bacterium]
MKAFITGIAGQDGSYLSEYLLEMGYEVHGMIRRQSTPENQESRIAHLESKIKTYYGDVKDRSSIDRILKEVQPDIIYNLAAQSHVRISFDIPQETFQTNAVGVLNMLEAYRGICPNARFYQASSSEMFGNSVDADGYQRITTPMHPVSPYGIAKLAAYNFVSHYRNAYKLHAVNGILFNHESERRASNFVTNKICKAAVMISNGLQKELALGNLDSFRDWGHSYDYVRAIHKIVTNDKAEDFVVATGMTFSVRQLCYIVFDKLGLDYSKHIKQDEKFIRPEELKYLRGDSKPIREKFGWHPQYTFESMIEEMIEYWKDRI